MKDRLTQVNLLPPVKKRSFSQAVKALPQYRGLRRFFRPLHSGARFARLRLWTLGLRPLLQRLWQWFLHTAAVRNTVDWAKRFRKAVLALPQYQFLCRVHRFFNTYPTTRFLFYLALMAAIELPICLNHTDISYDTHIYLIVDEMGPQVIQGRPEEDRSYPLLTISSDTAPSDVQLILQEGTPVTIRRGKTHFSALSRQETVANLLRRYQVDVTDQEMIAVNVAGSTPIIHISDELRYERNVETFTPYQTRTYSNYLLEKGTCQIIQEGQPGCITDTYEDVYRLGELVDSQLIARSNDSAVTHIVEYGHLVHSMAQNMRAVKDRPFRDGSGGGYLIFESGDSMIYLKKVVNNATAYYGGTKTATGHAVGVGVIAVDPTVYPYHTSMYIGAVSGGSYYGIGTAYDCGGAVKGNIIDIWYPTFADCARWGRRNVTCYILKDINVS